MSLCIQCLHPPPLRILLTLCQRSPSNIQTRKVYLMHNALSKAKIGLHKLIPWERLDKPYTPNETPVCVRVPYPSPFLSKGVKLATETHTIEDLIRSKEYLRPGVVLYREPPESVEDKEHKDYHLHTLKDIEMTPKRKKAAMTMKGRHCKRVQFATVMEKTLFLTRVQLCWDFLKIKIPVEVHVKPTKRTKWANVDWTLEHQVHFNPDVILKAMPDRTFYNIKPRRHGEEYCWVMSVPGGPYGDIDQKAEEQRLYIKKLHDRAAKWDDGSLPKELDTSPLPKSNPLRNGSRKVFLANPASRTVDVSPPRRAPEPRSALSENPSIPGLAPEPRPALSENPSIPRLAPEPRSALSENPSTPRMAPEPRSTLSENPSTPTMAPEPRPALSENPSTPKTVPEPHSALSEDLSTPRMTPEPRSPLHKKHKGPAFLSSLENWKKGVGKIERGNIDKNINKPKYIQYIERKQRRNRNYKGP